MEGQTVSTSAIFRSCSVLPTNSCKLSPGRNKMQIFFFYRLQMTLQQGRKLHENHYYNWNDLWMFIQLCDISE